MLDVHSITFTLPTPQELRIWRAIALLDRSFEVLAAAVVRSLFLRAVMPGSFGHRAGQGLAVVERAQLLLLAARPAADERELRGKAMLFRCAQDDEHNTIAMLSAALEADCRRLGCLCATDSPEVGGASH